MDRQWIERYAQGASAPRRAIKGLTREDLNRLPVTGRWSIQQIVVHLMDSDLIGSDRMKRVAAEDEPTLVGYNQDRFVERLHYDAQDAECAARVFELNRLLTAEVLRRLPDDAFARVGHHTETGRVTLEGLLKGYVEHLEHHLRFLYEKRRLIGKPL